MTILTVCPCVHNWKSQQPSSCCYQVHAASNHVPAGPFIWLPGKVEVIWEVRPLEPDLLQAGGTWDIGAGGAIRVCGRGGVSGRRPSIVDSFPLAPCRPNTSLVSQERMKIHCNADNARHLFVIFIKYYWLNEKWVWFSSKNSGCVVVDPLPSLGGYSFNPRFLS